MHQDTYIILIMLLILTVVISIFDKNPCKSVGGTMAQYKSGLYYCK
jgi:hypothetical protein